MMLLFLSLLLSLYSIKICLNKWNFWLFRHLNQTSISIAVKQTDAGELSPLNGMCWSVLGHSLPWELACRTPMLSSNCIDLMLSDAKMHSLSCSEASSILFWLADRITHMSQRLMFTALKSARLNGVPFSRDREQETHGGGGSVRKKMEKNKLKITLWTAKKLVNNLFP